MLILTSCEMGDTETIYYYIQYFSNVGLRHDGGETKVSADIPSCIIAHFDVTVVFLLVNQDC